MPQTFFHFDNAQYTHTHTPVTYLPSHPVRHSDNRKRNILQPIEHPLSPYTTHPSSSKAEAPLGGWVGLGWLRCCFGSSASCPKIFACRANFGEQRWFPIFSRSCARSALLCFILHLTHRQTEGNGQFFAPKREEGRKLGGCQRSKL